MKRIQVFINKCLRKLLRTKWADKCTNEEEWRRTSQRPVVDEIGRRRWRWIGHTLRKNGCSITKKALDWNPQGKRTRGRPRGTWRWVVDKDIQRGGRSWNELKKIAQNRGNGSFLSVAYILIQGEEGYNDYDDDPDVIKRTWQKNSYPHYWNKYYYNNKRDQL